MSPIVIIIAAVMLSVGGQILVKMGLNDLGSMEPSMGFLSFYATVFLCPWVISGLFIYFVSGLFWLNALTKVDLSFAFPFLALSYVFILLISRFFLGESVPLIRWVGVLVICFGVGLVSMT